MKAKHLITLWIASLLFATPVMAKPAGFYVWQSKSTSQRICLQYSPNGDAWIKVNGPYKDANCRVRKRS